MDARMRVSASRINTWMTCPLQARFTYIDRLPRQTNAYATFGSCVHHALEHYNTSGGDLASTVKLFEDIWDSPEKIGSPIEIWPPNLSYTGGLQRGKDMLRGYHEKLGWAERTMIAAEHSFLVPFGSYEIQGIVDLVETQKSGRGKNTVKVIDYKTNKRMPYRDTLRLNVQMTCYDWAVRQKEFWVGNGPDFPPMPNGEYWWEMLKSLPMRTFWYHLENQRELDAGSRDEQDYKRLYRVCQMMERAEKFNVFVPTISAESCLLCSFTKECGIPVEQFDNNEDDWI